MSLATPSSAFGNTRRVSPGVSQKNTACTDFVYIELHATMPAAIKREKQIKEWKRAWKLQLIESVNPEWRDLYEDIWR